LDETGERERSLVARTSRPCDKSATGALCLISSAKAVLCANVCKIEARLTQPTVAFVSATYPYPSDNGKKTAIAGILRFLAETIGLDNVTYLLLGGAPGATSPSLSTVTVPLGAASQRIASLCWYSLVLRRKSLQESLLYTRSVRRRLRACISRLDPDIVILDTIRIAQFFEDAPSIAPRRRWVLYMEDLFSLRYRMLARDLAQASDRPADRAARAAADPLGAFAYVVPAAIRPLVRSAGMQALLYRLEETLVACSERRLAAALQQVCLVNGEEVSLLARDVPGVAVTQTPPCISTPAVPRAVGAHEGPFLIVGALDYPPNVLAVTEFLSEAMPSIAQAMPRARIKIVGKGASTTLVALCNRWGPQVELVGYVPDLSVLMASAAAMIVPVRLGSGPKLKSLEALAHGLPLITTRNGVEAIAVVPDVHCLVSDDLRMFPAFMQRLREPKTNEELSQRCRSLFQSEYSSKAVYPRYAAAFLGQKQEESLAVQTGRP
jgi:glycosyltransferase involved in cell wall biosynthesis